MINTTKCLNSTYTIINLVHRILNAIWSLIEMPSHSLCWGPPQLALLVEFLFEILCVGAPQLALLVEFLFEILCVGAPQLALPVEFLFEILFVGASPQLTLSVEFLFEILFVGAPVSNLKSCYNRIFVWSMSVYIIL